MTLIQYSRQDFLDVRDNYQIPTNLQDTYEDIINTINSQLFQNNKFIGSKSGKDWRKKKLPSFLERHVSDGDKIKNKINLELNKLSVENYRSIFISIKDILDKIDDEQYSEVISMIIDNVFEKAVVQPVYCPYYVKLVFSLFNEDNKTLITTLLRNKCTIYHHVLTKNVKTAESNNNANQDNNSNEDNNLDNNLDNNSDNNSDNKSGTVERDEQEEYDDYCRQLHRKNYKKGFSQFVGELYNNDIIMTREIIFFYRQMISNISDALKDDTIDEDFIEDNIIYLQKLIEISIKKLLNRQKKNLSPIHQLIKNIDDTIKSPLISKISPRLKFKLKDCYDVLKNNTNNKTYK